jgi:hypothetical protein
MATIFDKINDITQNYVVPGAQIVTGIAQEDALRQEGSKYNSLNGSGAPNQKDFLSHNSPNVDGATSGIFTQLTGNLGNSGKVLLVVALLFAAWYLFKKLT